MYPSAALLLLDDEARDPTVDLARQHELNVTRVYEASRSNLREAFEAIRADAADHAFGILLLETLDLPGVGTRRLLAELSVLTELGVELGSVREPYITLKGDQGELVRWLHGRLSTERSRNVAEGIARSKKKPGRPRAPIPTDECVEDGRQGLEHPGDRPPNRRQPLGSSAVPGGAPGPPVWPRNPKF